MAYTKQNKAHSNHYITKPDGSTASRYSRYETGRITGRYREIPAVLADSTGFDSLGFDSSVGSVDDRWHVVNVFDSVNTYIDSIAVGGAMDGNHALQIAKSQLDSLGGTTCQLITNNAMQFDGMDHDHAWSIDAINKLMDNPSQNKSYLPVITAPELVVEAERVTFDSVQWDSNNNLISHGGKDSRLYLDLTRADTRNELVTEFDLADALFDMDAQEAGFDALMDTKSRLPLLKDRLFKALSQAGDESLSVTNVTQTKEFKRQGVINIAFVFDLSDGQKLSIWFHKPLESSSKLLPSDYMVSWKWMLNKRDVTAALSPKHGDNVQLPALARRIMRVAAKNSKRFKAAQARKAKVEQELLDAEQTVADRKSTISMLDIDIMDLNKKIDMVMQERKDEAEKPPEPEKPKGGAFSEGDAVIWMGEYGEISRGTFKNYSADGATGIFVDDGGQMRAPISQLIFNPDVQLTDEQIAAKSEADKHNEMEAIISSLSKSSKRFKEWDMTVESVQALPKEQFLRLADALATAKMPAYEQLLIAYRVGKQDLIGIAQSIIDNERSAGQTTIEITKRRERLAQILSTELTLVGSKKDDNSNEDATISITGQEIDVSEGVDFKTAKNNAMAYFDETLKDKVVFCQAIDSDVALKRRGGKHIAKANHTFRDKLQLVAAIPEMIKKGKYYSYTEAYKDKAPNIYGYYVLTVSVEVDGIARDARVVLEKTDKGEALYDIGINKKEALAALGDAVSNESFDRLSDPSHYQGLNKSYQDDNESVKQFDKVPTNDEVANDLILNIFFDEDLDLTSDTTTDNKVTKGSVNESTTVKGTKISSNFALVEAKKLIVSHDAAGVANPDFPQALQPRDRSDKKSVEAIKANAKKLQPEKLGQTDRVGNGAPIVGDDLIVESGNGRAMAVKLAYDNGDAENYRAWLIENADEFGFSAEQVEAYKQPVLVRVRTTAIDRIDFAIEANQDGYPQYFDNEESGDEDKADPNTIPIREALEYVKANIFDGKDDQVLMYVTDRSTGEIKETKLVKASSKSAQTRWSNKFVNDDTTGSVYNQSIPKTNSNAATLLEDLGYKINYADPEGFIDDQFKVGDAYRFIDPNDANDTGSVLEFKSWEGINRGNDEPILSFSSFSGASGKSFKLSEMQKLVADGAAVLVTDSEAQEAKDFETEQPVSVYVNSKGRELVTVTYSYGQYNLKGSGFMSGADDEAGVLKLLRSIRKDNKSMKLKEGKEFFPAGDDGKEYPPLEYDAESKTVTAYMNSKKKDSWTAIPKDDGGFTVYADNAQTRAYRTSAPKMFDNSEDLIATYPAFRGIDALLAKHSTSSDDVDYAEIDESEYPELFLDRNSDKLNILGIGDDNIHVGNQNHGEDSYSDLYHIDAGIFKDMTLNFTDAVCKTVDAAISLGADAVVGDFTATAYQDSMFDGLDSKSNPTYGITVQIEKGGVYLRADIDAYGECKILKGASGTDVITTIKHVFTDNTNEYQSALADALDIQVDDDMSTTDTHDAPNTAETAPAADQPKDDTLDDPDALFAAFFNEFYDEVMNSQRPKIQGLRLSANAVDGTNISFESGNGKSYKILGSEYNPSGKNVNLNLIEVKANGAGYTSQNSMISIVASTKVTKNSDWMESLRSKKEWLISEVFDVLDIDYQEKNKADTVAEPATSAAAKRINEIEQQMSAADFDPMTVDTDELIDLVDQVEGDAELSAKLDYLSTTLQQKIVAVSMKALTDMAGA